MRRATALFFVSCFVGCANTPAATPPGVTLRVKLPPGVEDRGVLSAVRFDDAEVDAGLHRDLAHIFTVLERVERLTDLDGAPDTLTLRFPATGAASHAAVYLDARGDGLDAVLDSPLVFARLPASGTVEISAPASLHPTRPAPCSGPRLERMWLDAPELRRAGDDGRHALCVYLPADYATSPERRYPLVLALPGFSGHDERQDGFGARFLFDEAAARQAVILVGVETRIPEGTSYLASSPHLGDWEGYVLRRVLPELDRRYRTSGRRAVFGHSTGGWNALSLALRHPTSFDAVGVSSPDPLDLDAWLLDDRGQPKAKWWHWARAEQRLGGRGQFTSWAASWSDGASLFDHAGALRPQVHARWKAHSPRALLAGDVASLSGRVFITAGRRDLFELFEPTERFVTAARERGLDVAWAPTDLDHFGETRERFAPLVDFLLRRLGAP